MKTNKNHKAKIDKIIWVVPRSFVMVQKRYGARVIFGPLYTMSQGREILGPT